MLHSLVVENIALIDRLSIEFAEGLNILTGETGAGKSIIIDSMNLALGERADREMIRRGEESASVEALFYVDIEVLRPVFERYGIEVDEELLVSRKISSSGKNTCRINGGMVNLSTLKGFMDSIVDLVGQHEHQSLLYPENHLAIIDSFGGAEVAALKEDAARAVSEIKRTQAEMAELGGDAAERAASIELLEFQTKELADAELKAGELEELGSEREVLAGAQTIAEQLGRSYAALYEGDEAGQSILAGLKSCADGVAQLARYGENFAVLSARMEEGYYLLEEAAHDIGREMGAVVFDEQRQNEVEERIEFINTLKRKYGATDEEELISIAEQAQERLSRLCRAGEIYEGLEAKLADQRAAAYKIFSKLSAKRRKAADVLAELALAELADLGMPGAAFETRFAELAAPEQAVYTAEGLDFAEFYISTNAGEPLKPLAKTASGGEISRIMLAFKNITAGRDSISTMIFDEIDTGISGRMAHVVAEKMAAIAQSRQVICVTHLAQIAAMADRGFLISKQSRDGTTLTSIDRLDEGGIKQEIARLSGGIDTENAMNHAQELLSNARAVKDGLAKTGSRKKR